jgi:predicted  nucleic acid-binding Zn-ribbon protein
MSIGDPARNGSEPLFRVVRRGFDPEQVVEYLRQLGHRIQVMEDQLQRAERELQEVQNRRADPLAGVSEHVVELIREFDETVERARAKAEADAGRIQAEAREKAEAQLEEARREAERVRLELEGLRAAKSAELRAIRDRMAGSLREIESALADLPSEEPSVMVIDDERAARIEVPGPPNQG